MAVASVLFLALGLAMDATAVAAARGLSSSTVRARDAARVAAWFGGAQALMPLLGWLLGSAVGGYVEAWDHWIACALLVAVGAHMLWEAAHDDEPAAAPGDPFAARALFPLAVATSIDALAAGVTLPMIDLPPALSIATIGVVTAALSAAGVFAGRRFGALLGRRLELAGGLVLVALGVKVVVEHTWMR